MLTSPMEILPFKIDFNFLAGTSAGMDMSSINLTLKTNQKFIFIYKNWSDMAIVYHSSK